MRALYKREQGHNYLLLFSEQGNAAGIDRTEAKSREKIDRTEAKSREEITRTEAESQAEMARRNRIPGLVPLGIEWENNCRYYRYEITGLQPLSRLVEFNGLEESKVRALFVQLAAVLVKLEEYLLDWDSLLLEAEYLYLSPDGETYKFLFYPEAEGDCQENMKSLAQYLLAQSGTETGSFLELVLRFYRLCAGAAPDPEALLSCLQNGPPGDEAVREEAGNSQEMLPWEAEEWGEIKREKSGLGARIKESLKRLFQKKRTRRKRYPDEAMWDELEPEQSVDSMSEGSLRNMSRNVLQNTEENPTELLYVEEQEAAGPFLYNRRKEEKIVLEKLPFFIGSQAGTDYNPQAAGVSRLHVRIKKGPAGYQIMDLNSTNGTKLNGRSLSPNGETPLHHGDKIWIAGLVYEFREFDTEEKS